MNWLVLSVVLSIALTVALNVGVRAFPQGARRLEQRADGWNATRVTDGRPRVRVFFPWKTMLVASVALTVLVNIVALLTR